MQITFNLIASYRSCHMPEETSSEKRRLDESCEAGVPWRNGDLISANGSGERFEKTTVKTAMPGATSVMTNPVREPITGAKTVLPDSHA